jgi:serine phosphatase RsbU (regulator of sigma subunit)
MNKFGRVVWTKSLHFKLFTVFSVFLLALVSAMTVENSSRLDAVLSRQSKDTHTFTAQRAASAIHANLTSWNAAIHTATHLANRYGIENAGSVADSLLASNSLAIAFSFLSLEKTSLKEEMFRFTNDRSRHGLLRGATSVVLEQVRKPPTIELLESAKESPRLLVPEGGESQNLIQLWVPFKIKVRQSEKTMWAGVTFLNTTLASFLPSSAHQMAALFSQDALPLLTPPTIPLKNWQNHFFTSPTIPFLKTFFTHTREFRSEEHHDSQNQPVLKSAQAIQGFGATILIEKRYSAELQAIKIQITKALMWSWILFLFTTAFVYIMARKLTKRIHDVIDVAARLAAGDLNASIEEGQLDEVGVLTRSVNHLGSAIRELMKEHEQAIIQDMELKTAHAVQEGLFPEHKLESHNQLASCYVFRSASKCAGDWWGRVTIDLSRELIVIGDALGHGVPAALVAAQAFSYFESSPLNKSFQKDDASLNPASLIGGFNNVLWRSGRGTATMTIFAACFDMNAMTVTCSGAGHTAPFFLSRKSESQPKGIITRGRVAGSTATSDALNITFPIAPGDRFFLFTDGLMEASNKHDEPLGRERLRALFQKTRELDIEQAVQSIERELFLFTEENKLHDDVTFVILEVLEKETPQP